MSLPIVALSQFCLKIQSGNRIEQNRTLALPQVVNADLHQKVRGNATPCHLYAVFGDGNVSKLIDDDVLMVDDKSCVLVKAPVMNAMDVERKGLAAEPAEAKSVVAIAYLDVTYK